MEITQHMLDRMNDNTLYHTFGIRILEAADGEASSRLEPDQKVCWPFQGQPHGGILFTLMDTTMAWAIVSQLDQGYNCTTISMAIQYVLPARGESFGCRAWVVQRTGRMSFMRAEIHDQKDQLVAMGQATFRIIKADFIT
jgi:uncharacterized protein (TIGR00369 family)